MVAVEAAVAMVVVEGLEEVVVVDSEVEVDMGEEVVAGVDLIAGSQGIYLALDCPMMVEAIVTIVASYPCFDDLIFRLSDDSGKMFPL